MCLCRDIIINTLQYWFHPSLVMFKTILPNFQSQNCHIDHKEVKGVRTHSSAIIQTSFIILEPFYPHLHPPRLTSPHTDSQADFAGQSSPSSGQIDGCSSCSCPRAWSSTYCWCAALQPHRWTTRCRSCEEKEVTDGYPEITLVHREAAAKKWHWHCMQGGSEQLVSWVCGTSTDPVT